MIISDVQFKDGRYYVYDEDGNEFKSFWDNDGKLIDWGLDFLVFERNDQYRIVNVETEKEIACEWCSTVGRLKHANGDLVVFKRDNQIFTYRVGYSSLTQTGCRWS